MTRRFSILLVALAMAILATSAVGRAVIRFGGQNRDRALSQGSVGGPGCVRL
jgi:hypothetical protein